MENSVYPSFRKENIVCTSALRFIPTLPTNTIALDSEDKENCDFYETNTSELVKDIFSSNMTFTSVDSARKGSPNKITTVQSQYQDHSINIVSEFLKSTEIENLRIELEKAKIELSKLNKQLTNHTVEEIEIRKFRFLHKDCDSRLKEIEAKNTQIQNLTKELAELKEAQITFQKENSSLKSMNSELTSQLNSSKSIEANIRKQENSRLQEFQRQFESDISRMRQSNEKKVNELHSTISLLQSNQSTLEFTNQSLNSELESLATLHEKKEKETLSLYEQYEGVCGRETKLCAEVIELKKKSEILESRLEEQASHFETQLEKSKKEKNSLKSKFKDKDNEISQLKLEVEKVRIEKDKSEVSLKSIRSRSKDSEKRICKLSDEIARLNELLKFKAVEMEALMETQNKTAENENHLVILSEEVVRLNDMLVAKDEELQNCRDNRSFNEKLILEDFQEYSKELESRVMELAMRNGELEVSLRNSKSECTQSMKDEYYRNKEELRIVIESRDELINKINSHESQLKVILQEISTLQSSLSSKNWEIENMKKIGLSYEAKISELNILCRSREESKCQSQSHFEQLNRELDEKEKSRLLLSQSLESKSAECNRLASELNKVFDLNQTLATECTKLQAKLMSPQTQSRESNERILLSFVLLSAEVESLRERLN